MWENASTWVPSGRAPTIPSRVSTETPVNLMPNFDSRCHTVDRTLVCRRLERVISSHVHVVGRSTRLSTTNDHASVGSLGVASAVRTGQSLPASY